MPMKTKEQQRGYQNEWIKRRRNEWFEANGPCKECGSTNDLQLDHIDPKLKVSSHIWSWSQTRRDSELCKCQVLCRACHQKKTKIDLKAMFSDIPNLKLRQHSDERFLRVLKLIEEGYSEREACSIEGLSRGTYSSTKIRKQRMFRNGG
jgi:5-methylcytosine-specific restriction endonuclease McrA